MTHQTTFAHAEFAAKKKTACHEKFLAHMEEVIPWAQLLAVIKPHYPGASTAAHPSVWSGCCASISSSNGMS